jgi:hypothetical protein
VIVLPYHVRYFTYDRAQLAYSYNVNGELFLREGSAERFTEELKGKATCIRSKPKAPDVSALLLQDQQSVWPLQL